MTAARRTGRRPGENTTRDAILVAARRAFAARGYGATIRQIAGDAGVDPALVLHYYGSKHGLFVAAMDLPVDPTDVIPATLAGDPATAGERLVRRFVGVWDAAAGTAPMIGLLRAASGDPRAADMLRQFIAEAGPGAALRRLGVPQADLRGGLIASQLLGLMLVRHVLRLEPVASLDEDALVAALAPTVQRYLTTDLTSIAPPTEAP